MSTPEIDLVRYQRWAEREDARIEAIEREQRDLMAEGGSCDPYDGVNFKNAIANTDNETMAEKLDHLLKADEPDFEAIGKALYYINFDYWDEYSQSMAEDLVGA